MFLSDRSIRRLCLTPDGKPVPRPMLEPFVPRKVGDGTISYGLGSAGYDLRLGYSFLVYKNTSGEPVDPKRFKDPAYCDRVFDKLHLVEGQPLTLAAGAYCLGFSLEYIRMPNTLIGICLGKSTYVRCGVSTDITPLEPGWEGNLTLEIANHNNSVATLYPGEGIAQLLFGRLDEPPENDYAALGGTYQNQAGLTPARVAESRK